MKRGVIIILVALSLTFTATVTVSAEIYADNSVYADTVNTHMEFITEDGVPDAEQSEDNVTLAATGTYYEQYGLYFDESTGTITDADETLSGSYNIPTQIDGVDVKAISSYAFKDCILLEKICVPKTVESIGVYAFQNSIKEVEFEEGTTKIPDYACCYANNLEKAIIPNSVISIGRRAFFGCKNLSSFPALTSLEEIGESAFAGCASLEKLYIPKTVGIPGECAFYNSVKEIEFEEGITEIPYFFCYYATNLERVVIPDSVISIGYKAFEGCEKLSSFPALTSLWEIGDDAFIGCVSLEKLYIPKTMLYIGTDAFKDSVREIEFEEGITGIQGAACKNATNLERVVIPNSVTSIGNSAFEGCSKLSSFPALTSLAKIGESAFAGCSKLSSFPTLTSLVEIGKSAFKDCWALEKMYIPKTIESIGQCAFENSIKEIEFEEGITKIPDNACRRAYLLKNAIVPDSVTLIGEKAFEDCRNLSSFPTLTSLTEIGYGAFYGCRSLQKVYIPKTTESIGRFAFKYSIKEIEFEEGTTQIPNYFCDSADYLEKAVIPDSVTSIGEKAFYCCDRLRIYCYPGSYAMDYAVENNIPVTFMGNEETGVYTAFSKYEIEQNQITVNTVVANNSESEENVTVVIAAYADDELKEIATDNISISANAAQNVTKTFDKGSDTVKIFIWDSLDGMMPCGDCMSLDITEE